jgi:hypothetical protein
MKSKKELIDAVVEAIKIDLECCYTEAIEELLTFLPIENLIEFLPEELWKNYQHLINK